MTRATLAASWFERSPRVAPREAAHARTRLVGASLLLATGAIHLDLYLTGYRSIPTIGWLFLLQVISAFVIAVGLVVSSSWLAPALGAGFAASTFCGYLLSLSIGLFGFKEVRTTAGIVAGIIEIATVAVLGAVFLERNARRTLAGRVALTVLVAAASVLLVADVSSASGPGLLTGGSGKTEVLVGHVGSVEVLTNSRGLTLYWFAIDTPSASRCYRTCAIYWPPLLGRPAPGRGVIGHLGIMRRTDGVLQATYDGHPLYTYVSDTGPGMARGNDLDLNGGLWHEVKISR